MYLLDTNVISETMKKSPNEKVLGWLHSIDANKFYLSALTFGEIRKGIESMSNEPKRQKIIQWLEIDLVEKFYGRIISIDMKVADKWGYICALNNLPVVDGLIAASAIAHNYKLVTRNVKDFNIIGGLEIINPWEISQ